MQLLSSKPSIISKDTELTITVVSHIKYLVSTLKNRLSIVRHLLNMWRQRAQQRKALTQLSPYLLKDIGINRSDAINEAEKPFWKS